MRENKKSSEAINYILTIYLGGGRPVGHFITPLILTAPTQASFYFRFSPEITCEFACASSLS